MHILAVVHGRHVVPGVAAGIANACCDLSPALASIAAILEFHGSGAVLALPGDHLVSAALPHLSSMRRSELDI